MQKYIRRETNEAMSVEDILKLILKFFQETDKRLEELKNKLSVWDIKQQEILHYIENHNLNAAESCKLIKLLKNIRSERRIIKDEMDIIRSVKDTFIDKYKNKFIEKDLIQTIKNLKQLEIRQTNPKYTYQYLTEELEIKDE